MKIWYGLFNIVAILIILCSFSIWNDIEDVYEVDYDTRKLQIITDNAAEAAFIEVKNNGESLDNSYIDIVREVVITPDQLLDTYEKMVCIGYDMAVTEENKKYVESYISNALLACTDGYYVTQLESNYVEGYYSETGEFKEGTSSLSGKYYTSSGEERLVDVNGGRERDAKGNLIDTRNGKVYLENGMKLDWGMKRPYMYKDSNAIWAYTLDGKDSVRMEKTGVGYGWGISKVDVLDSENVSKVVNKTIQNALAYSIKVNAQYNNTKINNVYIPMEQTGSGINSINGQSLIIVMQQADFAGKAKLKTVTMGGFKIVQKRFIVGYEIQRRMNGVWETTVDENGLVVDRYRKEYCYADQLKEKDGERIRNKVVFETKVDAAKDGYNPSLDKLLE